MSFFRRGRWLLPGYILCTVLLASALAAVYIPKCMAIKQHEAVTLRELSLDSRHYYLWLGDDVTAGYTMVPEGALNPLEWTIADRNVASFDGDCIVSKNPGETVITLRGDNGVSASAELTVFRKPLPPGSDLPELYYEPLIIANTSNPLGEDYKPEMEYLPDKYPCPRPTMLTPETLDAYERMYRDCKAATGRGFILLSGYRSYEKQVELFEEDVASFMRKGYNRSDAEKKAGLTTQLPGCSEHQLGLSADISTTGDLQYNFGKTTAGSWVWENCWKYGFILRYPEGKYDYTRIDYEAWHFRYVGVEHAKYIFDHDLCLEEYVERQRLAETAAEQYAEAITAEEHAKTLQ